MFLQDPTVLQITQIQFDFLSSFISWKYCHIALVRRLDDIVISNRIKHTYTQKTEKDRQYAELKTDCIRANEKPNALNEKTCYFEH